MGMMGRMRSLAPWFIITVGGLFVLFMVLSDSKVAEIFGRRSNNVGSINGEEISYQEYAQLVDRYKTFQEEQLQREISELQMGTFRDQVWDVLVQQKMMQKKIDEYGIKVSDEEIKNVILGPNPPEHLKRNFIDSTGNFNRKLYEQALFDPRNKQALIQEEERIREQLLQEKLQQYVTAAVTVNEDEVKDKYLEENIKMAAEYASIPAFSIQDSAVSVTEEQLKEYYSENKEEFKVYPQRKIKFVLFRKVASKDDTISVINDMKAIAEKLKANPSNFKSYVDIYSEAPYSQDTATISTTPEDVWNALYNAKPNEVVGPFETFKGITIHKMIKKIKGKDLYIRASHILIKGTDKEAKKKIDELYKQLRNGADFATLAKENSVDPSASKGGDLGYFKEGTMVKPFWDACKKARIGKVTKPVKTQFGYHLILVTDKTKEKIIVETIVNNIKISPTTIDKLYNNANDFAYLANKEGFEEIAKEYNYKIGESIPFRKEASTVPGIGANRALVRFAFENSVGDVGQVYNVANGYLVPMVSEEIPEGYKKFDDVKGQIRSKLLLQKKLEKAGEIAQKIRERIGDGKDLKVAIEVYPKARVSTTGEFKPGGVIPGIGNEFAVANFAKNAEVGIVSNPLKGRSAYFIVKLLSKTPFNEKDFEAKKASIRKRLLATKKAEFYNNWVNGLKDEADVVDNRHLFYR